MSVNNENDKQKIDENNGDDSNIVTMLDVLEQEKELEQEYVAVLGGSDEKHCTYSKGYIKRQALYSCLTCKPTCRTDPSPSQQAGVCLACSYKCHEGHEMVELYTKRNFRCDCGTTKLSAAKCNLNQMEFEENAQNAYNQNFSGTYCVCHRPYPDPEDPIDDEMIQCVVCEDWFHCRHLGVKVPSMNNFTEMICGECTEKCDLLLHYRHISVFTNENEKDNLKVTETPGPSTNSKIKKPIEEEPVNASIDVEKVTKEDNVEVVETETNATDSIKTGKEDDQSLKDEINQCIMDIIQINKKKSDEKSSDEPPSKKQKLMASTSSGTSNNNQCKKPPKSKKKFIGASFWPVDWRLELCKCINCMLEFKKYKVEFLADIEDTVLSYEEKGIAKARETESEYDSGMKELQRMNHTQKIDVIMGYNKMKEKLTEFLCAFVTSKQVVTEEDINRFFRMLKDKNESVGSKSDSM